MCHCEHIMQTHLHLVVAQMKMPYMILQEAERNLDPVMSENLATT